MKHEPHPVDGHCMRCGERVGTALDGCWPEGNLVQVAQLQTQLAEREVRIWELEATLVVVVEAWRPLRKLIESADISPLPQRLCHSYNSGSESKDDESGP